MFRNICFVAGKNAIILVLLIEEISFRPELSSPPLFRIQGGGPLSITNGGVGEMEILVSNIGLYEWQLIRNDNDNSKDHIMDGTSKDDLIDSLPKDDFMTIIG
jgi:hypothetical protein